MSTEATRIPFSPWAQNVAPSPTLAVDSKAKALAAAGETVCGFGAGEPDFDTPKFIKAACIAALERHETKYAPNPGLPALRAALSEKYRKKHKVEGVRAENILISPGGKYSCALAIQGTCGPGDEVIIPAPYWVSYPEMAKLAGAKPAVVTTGQETGFKLTVEALKSVLTPQSRLLILNSPSNPTGAVYTRKELEALVRYCIEETNLTILSDEIYEDLIYDDLEHITPASFSKEAAERILTASGFSKSFSMTGWRLGTLMGPTDFIKKVANIQSNTTSAATTFAQHGALAIYEQPEEAANALRTMRAVFDERRLKLFNGLNAIEGIECPRAQGAFYLFPKVAALGLDSDTFADRLLDAQKVAVVPGSGFGADGYIRVSYAISDAVIDLGLERLAEFCKGL